MEIKTFTIYQDDDTYEIETELATEQTYSKTYYQPAEFEVNYEILEVILNGIEIKVSEIPDTVLTKLENKIWD